MTRISEDDALIDELGDLLDAERVHLLAGDFDRLERLAEQKEGLIERLSARDGDAPARDAALGPLREKLRRNSALLKSAEDGVRAVRARLRDMAEVEASLTTYSATGERKAFAPARAGRFERHA